MGGLRPHARRMAQTEMALSGQTITASACLSNCLSILSKEATPVPGPGALSLHSLRRVTHACCSRRQGRVPTILGHCFLLQVLPLFATQDSSFSAYRSCTL